MPADLSPDTIFTEAEYYQIEERSSARHELQGHKVLLMPLGSTAHADISANVGVALGTQLRDRPFRVRIGNQKIQVMDAGLITYPDVLVVGQPERVADTNASTILDATLIVEVTSPASAMYDRLAKFSQYQYLHQFQDYLLIDQDRVHVEHRHLNEDGQWTSMQYVNLPEVIRLESIDCTLPLEEIYRGVFKK